MQAALHREPPWSSEPCSHPVLHSARFNGATPRLVASTHLRANHAVRCHTRRISIGDADRPLAVGLGRPLASTHAAPKRSNRLRRRPSVLLGTHWSRFSAELALGADRTVGDCLDRLVVGEVQPPPLRSPRPHAPALDALERQGLLLRSGVGHRRRLGEGRPLPTSAMLQQEPDGVLTPLG
jgi:hypothetical protein